MFRPSTITVAAIGVCGATLALGTSVAVQPRFVHPIVGVTPVAAEPTPQKIIPHQIPHKFMRRLPSTL